MQIRHPRPDGVGLNHLPSGGFAANPEHAEGGLWRCRCWCITSRWTARLGLGEQIVTTKTLRRRFFSLAGRLTHSRAASLCIFPSAGPGKPSSVEPSLDCEPCHFRPDGACLPLTRPPATEPLRQLAPSRCASA